MTKELGNIVDHRAHAHRESTVSQNAVSQNAVSQNTVSQKTGSTRRDFAAASTDDAVTCDLCGTSMYSFHCRLVCPNCGFQRDCSDP